MKTRKFLAVAILTLGFGFASFAQKTVMVGGAAMYPNKNIVENAVNSKDHTTLVAAVKAADLVETLQSKGPFTVFAPTNAAFDKLPAGTVATLLKPENKKMLQTICFFQHFRMLLCYLNHPAKINQKERRRRYQASELVLFPGFQIHSIFSYTKETSSYSLNFISSGSFMLSIVKRMSTNFALVSFTL